MHPARHDAPPADAADANRAASTPRRTFSATATAVWIALPALVICLLASGARFSANWPDPPERWAPQAALATLWILLMLLCARLVEGWTGTFATLALAAPPLAGAAALAQAPMTSALIAWLWLGAWLLALNRLSAAGRRLGLAGVVPACAGLLVGLACAAAYLAEDAGGMPLPAWSDSWPAREAFSWSYRPWLIPGSLLALGIFLDRVAAKTRSPRRGNNFSTR